MKLINILAILLVTNIYALSVEENNIAQTMKTKIDTVTSLLQNKKYNEN